MPTDFDLKERYNIVVRSNKELAIYDSTLDRSVSFGYYASHPENEKVMLRILKRFRDAIYTNRDFHWTDHREDKV